MSYALHGFLGLPTDWDSLGQPFGKSFEAVKIVPISHPKNGLQKWGQAFNRWVRKDYAQKRILLGYSQGGRLGMHALIDAPELWSGAIIVSANTGIPSKEERSARLQVDLRWAERFLKDPWEPLIDDWDRQAVFQGKKPSFPRKEADFVRSELANAIEGWSIGRQDDLREPLSKLSCPILWVAGGKDLKYVDIAKEMADAHDRSAFWVAPDAGHRVPWECPQLFLKEINTWIEQLPLRKVKEPPFNNF